METDTDYNMGKYFDPNICISVIITQFLIFTMKKMEKKYNSTRNLYIWATILSHIVVGYCSSCPCKCFSLNFHNIVNGIKPGSS